MAKTAAAISTNPPRAKTAPANLGITPMGVADPTHVI